MEEPDIYEETMTRGEKWRILTHIKDSDEIGFLKPTGKLTKSSLFSHNVQLIRSAGNWSLGLRGSRTENSIHLAYLELINKAEHFVYIENQFFISGTAGSPIKNQIAEALVLRIRRAIEEGKPFRVVVVLPLLPGFEGSIEEKNGVVTRLTLHYQQMTISKSLTSVFAQ